MMSHREGIGRMVSDGNLRCPEKVKGQVLSVFVSDVKLQVSRCKAPGVKGVSPALTCVPFLFLLSGLAPFPTSVVLGEPPPPYSPQGSPDSSSAPAINCRVCQSAISVEGKMHQHVVKCGICNEATVRRSPSEDNALRTAAAAAFSLKLNNLGVMSTNPPTPCVVVLLSTADKERPGWEKVRSVSMQLPTDL